MILDKKQIWTIFLFKFKMGHKAVVTTHNINNAFGLETADKYTVWWWFKKFCLGDESLEDEECTGQPLVVDSDQLRATTEADPVTATEEIAQEHINHSMVIWHLKQIGKVKKLNKWCLMSWPQIKKLVMCYHLLLYATVTISNQFVTWWKVDFIRQLQWPALWLDWEEAPKHSPTPYLNQRKVMVPVWWSAAAVIHLNFLNPGKTITSEKNAQQINEMHQKL